MSPDVKHAIDNREWCKFTKSTITEGEMDTAVKDGDSCLVLCKRLFDPAFLKGFPHDVEQLIGISADQETRVRVGHYTSQVAKVLHRAISDMKVGEVAHVSFELDHKLLNESFAKDLPVSDALTFDFKFELTLLKIELDHIALPRKIYAMNEQQLYKAALEHKDEANDLYRNKFYITAFQRYHKAMLYVLIAEALIGDRERQKKLRHQLLQQQQAIQEENEPQQQAEIVPPAPPTPEFDVESLRTNLAMIKAQLYSNLAACQLKNNTNEMVIKNCTNCINLDKKNLKCLYRRAEAYLNINDYENAVADLKEAMSQGPSEDELRDIRKKMEQVEQQKKAYQEKFSSNFKKMFN